ncbi:MAG: FlgD immunoglobulin-like domain containing protein [Gaiellaceae bacterium]
MQRLLSTAVLAGLLIATAAAFAVTERLKLEKSPVYGTKITPRLSPTCGCASRRATILLKLRRRDTVTVTIRARNRSLVDTLAAGSAGPRGANVFHWNGRTGRGTPARDGTYFVEIHLAKQHRTLLLPNEIVLDTVAPEVSSAVAGRPAFSPDGDRHADAVSVRYTLSEPAFLRVYVDGRRIVKGRFHRPAGSFTWAGTLGSRLLPPGTYVLSVGAVDLAGNRTPVERRARVRVELRYISLASRRIRGVRAGGRIEIGVSTDARRYGWRLGARHGFAHGPVLGIAAPAKAGRYRLVVTEHGHSDRALVIVR